MKAIVYCSNLISVIFSSGRWRRRQALSLVLFVYLTSSAHAQSKEWDKTFGGVITSSGSQTYGSSNLESVITTNNGYLLGGRSNSAIGNDKTQGRRGGYDYWLVSTDKNGNRVWDKRFGGSGNEDLQAVIKTADGGYLLGGTSASGISGDKTEASRGGQDYWILKINADGTKVWDRRFGGSGNDVLEALMAAPGGGFVLGGYSDSGANGDKSQSSWGNNDYWIVKIDESGTKVWDKRFGGSGNDVFKTLVLAPDGGYLLAGSSDSRNSGDKSQPAWGNQIDYWVIKINAAGDKIWDKRVGGYASDGLEALTATSDGGYLLGGYSLSDVGGDKTITLGWWDVGVAESWLVKIDGNGNKLWDNALQSTYHVANSLIATADGGYLLGGDNSDFMSEDDDYWIVKVNETGIIIWEKNLRGTGNDYLTSIVLTEGGEILLGGWSDSEIGEDKSEAKKGLTDYWLVKLQDVNCIPVVTNGCEFSDMIDNFSFNTLVNNSTGCNGQENGYISYAPSGNLTTTVTRDQSYNISVQASSGGNFPQGFGVWIDFNNDSDFDDADEFVFSSPIGTDVFTGTVIIPTGATPGQHRLRVRAHYDEVVTSDQSCAQFDYGETEDYIITIENTSGYAQWNLRYGGSGTDSYSEIIRTTDGGYLLGGYSNSSNNGDKTQLNRGGIDYWVVKINAAGNKQWDQRYGGPGDDFLNRLVPTLDGGYLLGGSSESGAGGDKSQSSRGGRDYWIVKISSTGQKQWDKRFGGSGYDELRKVGQLTTGEYFIAGFSSSPLSGDKSEGSRGGRDYWVLKLNAAGNKLWDKRFGGNLNDNLENYVLTSDGGYLLGGASSSGLSGDKTQLSRGGEDYWLVRLDGAGNKLWDKRFGGSDKDHLFSMGRLGSGSYFMGGYSISGSGGDKSELSQGGSDYWMLVINSQGEKQWDKRFGGNNDDELRSLIRTSDGGYLLGGKSNSDISGNKSQSSRGDSDYWVVKVNGRGIKQWDQRFGGTGMEELRNMLTTPDGGYLLGGRSASGISGDRTQSSQGGLDYWLLKVNFTEAGEPLFTQNEEAVMVEIPASKEIQAIELAPGELKDLKLNLRPNPFSEQLHVKFTLPQSEAVSLKVYDSQGKEVITLFQGQTKAGKAYEFQWRPRDQQAAGLYLLRLHTATKWQTEKIILTK